MAFRSERAGRGGHEDIERFRELGADVVAISPDAAGTTLLRYKTYGRFNFPVIPDVNKHIARSYGVYAPAKGDVPEDSAHGTFVIDQAGIVRWARIGTAPFGHNPTLIYELAKIKGLVVGDPKGYTSPQAIAYTMDLHKAAGKMPAHVKKDVPGFIGNRLQHALWREAISLVERGICDAKTVDDVVKASFGRRLAVLGPMENADQVGTDLTLAIHDVVLPAIENRPGPSPLLQQLVADGKLGFKSGQGFQNWSTEQQTALRTRVMQHLKAMRDR